MHLKILYLKKRYGIPWLSWLLVSSEMGYYCLDVCLQKYVCMYECICTLRALDHTRGIIIYIIMYSAI